ncbi:MAG: nucleotide exchange factor GrpE [Candidatus Saccharimonadales bacterium]
MSKKSEVTEEVQVLKQEIADLTDALQRERADVSNVRRQHDAQLGNLKQHVKIQVIEELLPVIDNFERALKHVPDELKDNAYVKGVQGVVKQFEGTLQQMGVERIKTVGEVFDPTVHEAVSMDEGEGTVEVVFEELQPGYRVGDSIIRHAMVKVRMQAAK